MLLAGGCWSTLSPQALQGPGELLCSLVPAAVLEGRHVLQEVSQTPPVPVGMLAGPAACPCVGCLLCSPVLGASSPPSHQEQPGLCHGFLPASATSAVVMT